MPDFLNIKLTVSYDGTNYKGWQIQKNGRTIQSELEYAIEKAFGGKRRVHGAGRTDAGVHARAQTAHFELPVILPVEKIPVVINALLPQDISVVKAEEVPPDFHSRFAAKSKHYEYRIFLSKIRDPFHSRYVWQVPYELNVSRMKKEITILKGKHDFKSFQASDNREKPSVRSIYSVSIKKEKQFIVISIAGDGFLYNMVRNIVGTLVEIGRGYFPAGSMELILNKKDRKTAGPTAPAKGLFLMNVKY